jgi:hypothetical protein
MGAHWAPISDEPQENRLPQSSPPGPLAGHGVHVEETEPWQHEGETWRVLRARFPGSIETQGRVRSGLLLR